MKPRFQKQKMRCRPTEVIWAFFFSLKFSNFTPPQNLPKTFASATSPFFSCISEDAFPVTESLVRGGLCFHYTLSSHLQCTYTHHSDSSHLQCTSKIRSLTIHTVAVDKSWPICSMISKGESVKTYTVYCTLRHHTHINTPAYTLLHYHPHLPVIIQYILMGCGACAWFFFLLLLLLSTLSANRFGLLYFINFPPQHYLACGRILPSPSVKIP